MTTAQEEDDEESQRSKPIFDSPEAFNRSRIIKNHDKVDFGNNKNLPMDQHSEDNSICYYYKK